MIPRIFKNISIALLLLGAFSFDNATSAMNNLRTQSCDCSKTFEELIGKLESNYVGLALITDTVRLAKYDSLKRTYLSSSKNISADTCTQHLDDFLSFFEDGHLSVFEFPKADSLTLARTHRFLQDEARELADIAELAKDSSDAIVGLWSDGASIFRIVKNQSYFDAYVVKSKSSDAIIGSLKLRLTKTGNEYRGNYYPYNFNARYLRGGIYKENRALRMTSLKWDRVHSETDTLRNIRTPRIKKIDEENTLLTLPSFSVDRRDFRAFLKENDKLLKSTSHLIIDIRGNAGGNSIYFPLIRYFATHDIRSKQGYVLASDDNRTYFKKRIGFGYSKSYSPLLKRMKKNGEVVDGPKYPNRKFSMAMNSIFRVSILMDDGSASAAESFVLHAKGASFKVATFGSASRGMIDFTSVNSLLLKNSGNQNIYFRYPTGTLHQEVMENGFNKTGILPDNPIPEGENKIQYIIDYYQ